MVDDLVSIIMPAYNAELYIGSAIESIVGQSYQNWELLVVNDASVDKTGSIVEQIAEQDCRVLLLTNTTNMGIANSRNLALKIAKGRFIAFLDSDDLWLPEKLTTQLTHMLDEKVFITYSGYTRINERGKYLGTVIPPKLVTYDDLLKSNYIGNLTGVYDCKNLGKEYFRNFKHEDYIAWLNLLKRTNCAHGISRELAQYRVYSGSASSNKFKTLSWQWRIYRESERLSVFKSCLLMISYIRNAVSKRL